MSRSRLFHSVADQIVQLIDDGVFPPGAKLPGERELADRFGVSRVTIREAEVALQLLRHGERHLDRLSGERAHLGDLERVEAPTLAGGADAQPA